MPAPRESFCRVFINNVYQGLYAVVLRALKARASIEIDQNRWDEANKTLDAVLAINKEDVEAIAMKATVAWLRDDPKAYDAERRRAFMWAP